MALTRVHSSSINTFPSSMRSYFDAYSRFTTELNLVNMLNRVTDFDSYVNKMEDGVLELTLGGYFFRVSMSELATQLGSLANNTDLYAMAVVRYPIASPLDARLVGCTGTDLSSYLSSTLDTYDDNPAPEAYDNSMFKGINFGLQADVTALSQAVDVFNDASDDTRLVLYSLKVLNTGSGTWVVPDDSQRKIDITSTNIQSISNAEIDVAWNAA